MVVAVCFSEKWRVHKNKTTIYIRLYVQNGINKKKFEVKNEKKIMCPHIINPEWRIQILGMSEKNEKCFNFFLLWNGKNKINLYEKKAKDETDFEGPFPISIFRSIICTQFDIFLFYFKGLLSNIMCYIRLNGSYLRYFNYPYDEGFDVNDDELQLSELGLSVTAKH